jgi:hypothetical protein
MRKTDKNTSPGFCFIFQSFIAKCLHKPTVRGHRHVSCDRDSGGVEGGHEPLSQIALRKHNLVSASNS